MAVAALPVFCCGEGKRSKQMKCRSPHCPMLKRSLPPSLRIQKQLTMVRIVPNLCAACVR